MAIAEIAAGTKPRRDFAWVREQSTTQGLTSFGLGATGIALIVLGTPVILALHGFTPFEKLAEGLASPELRMLLWVGAAFGVAAIVTGSSWYRNQPTKVSLEESAAGAILGMQTVALTAFLLWFVSGEVETFAFNYLKFDEISPLVPDFIQGAKNTVILAFSSELFGIVLGIGLAVFAISKRAVVRAPARIYINFFRGTPLVWQLTFIGIAAPIGLGINLSVFQAAIIALSLNAGAYTAEVFRAGIQSIDRGQLEAARGLGMSYMQAMRYSILPQAVRRVIPPLMNEFVILIKDTSLIIVLGLSTGQRDLMSVAHQAVSNSFNPSPYLAAALGYLIITLPCIRLVNVLEGRLRSGLVGIGG